MELFDVPVIIYVDRKSLYLSTIFARLNLRLNLTELWKETRTTNFASREVVELLYWRKRRFLHFNRHFVLEFEKVNSHQNDFENKNLLKIPYRTPDCTYIFSALNVWSFFCSFNNDTSNQIIIQKNQQKILFNKRSAWRSCAVA